MVAVAHLGTTPVSVSFSLVFVKDHSSFEGFGMQLIFFIAVLLPDFPL